MGEKEEEEKQVTAGQEPEIPVPNLKEIITIIKKMKNGKEAGENNITAELIKFGGAKLPTSIHQLVLSV